MATSGTVSTTVFTTRKVIDHAFRRCKLSPQQITAEDIVTANDLLWLFLSTIASKGIALWAVQREIIPLYGYVSSVPLPVGTVDLLNANLRNLNRPEGTYTASEGDADDAFDADIETACVQTVGEGWIQIEYDTETFLTSFGILPDATDSWNISIQVSDDGSTWETVWTNDEFEATEQEWFWVDVEGIRPTSYCRLVSNDVNTILNVAEFVAGNNPNEIPLAPINTDNYDSQPDKTAYGRPTEYRYDKQRTQPIMNLWPAPGPTYTFYQITARVQRYIQDVGTMTQEVEVPQRWYLAIICELARQLSYTLPQVKAEVMPSLESEAANQLKTAWDSESDGSAVQLRINISPYTR
jgi:hypothetical protein